MYSKPDHFLLEPTLIKADRKSFAWLVCGEGVASFGFLVMWAQILKRKFKMRLWFKKVQLIIRKLIICKHVFGSETQLNYPSKLLAYFYLDGLLLPPKLGEI